MVSADETVGCGNLPDCGAVARENRIADSALTAPTRFPNRTNPRPAVRLLSGRRQSLRRTLTKMAKSKFC